MPVEFCLSGARLLVRCIYVVTAVAVGGIVVENVDNCRGELAALRWYAEVYRSGENRFNVL